MKKLFITLFCSGIMATTAFSQGVGIGGTPDASAMLDVQSTTRGLLVPRMTQAQRTAIGTPANGLLVYQTDAARGLWYYDATTPTWRQVTSGGWLLNGNAGTNSATDFVGTTDGQALTFRTNNTARFRIANGNQVFALADGTAAAPFYSWEANPGLGLFRPAVNVLGFSTSGAERMRILANGQVVVNNTTPFAGDIFSSYAGAGEYAINGYGTTGVGVYGQATGENGVGVYGQATGANGVGVWGISNQGSGLGVIASNSNTAGTGLGVAGNNSTLYTLSGGSGIVGNGIPIGIVGYGNRSADGWGVLAAGNDLSGATINGGGGGSFQGRQWGVFADATITGNIDRAAFVGNFISAGTTASTVYVGARIGGTVYKILGTGGAVGASVSTTMNTRDGERILFAPESPENWFFDIGEVQLVNGKARVELDPLFYDCISHEKPFKVFVQGAENTLGAIRVKSRGSNWFELEDTGGNSNGIVIFSIYAIWKGKENLRLPKFENPVKVEQMSKVELQKGAQR